MKLLTKLEEIKQLGHYAVNFFYGEDIGCDDLDVKPEKRNVRLLAVPVGCLGERRIMWNGTLKQFISFDFTAKPIVISNPPKTEEYKESGYYTWGTEEAIKQM